MKLKSLFIVLLSVILFSCVEEQFDIDTSVSVLIKPDCDFIESNDSVKFELIRTFSGRTYYTPTISNEEFFSDGITINLQPGLYTCNSIDSKLNYIDVHSTEYEWIATRIRISTDSTNYIPILKRY
jgi:hypothetical protein